MSYLSRLLLVPLEDGDQPGDVAGEAGILIGVAAAGPGLTAGATVTLRLVGPNADPTLRALVLARVRGLVPLAPEAGGPAAEVCGLTSVASPF